MTTQILPIPDSSIWVGKYFPSRGQHFYAALWQSAQYPGYYRYAVYRYGEHTYSAARDAILAEVALYGLTSLLESVGAPAIDKFKWERAATVPFSQKDVPENADAFIPEPPAPPPPRSEPPEQGVPDTRPFVYFIEDSASQAIKIGIALDPKKRLVSLQIGNPNALKLIGYLRGLVTDEEHFHVKFSHLRIQGEWFQAADELREFIRANTEVMP